MFFEKAFLKLHIRSTEARRLSSTNYTTFVGRALTYPGFPDVKEIRQLEFPAVSFCLSEPGTLSHQQLRAVSFVAAGGRQHCKFHCPALKYHAQCMGDVSCRDSVKFGFYLHR